MANFHTRAIIEALKKTNPKAARLYWEGSDHRERINKLASIASMTYEQAIQLVVDENQQKVDKAQLDISN
jgi:hypothetical protein